MSTKVNVVLIDDHVMLRNGLANLIKNFGNYDVLFEASNGKEFIKKLQPETLPQAILMDINMPEMDGFETCFWLKEKYPQIKVLALSMYDNESSIIRMFKAGARGYILKDSDPAQLRSALDDVVTKGFYYSEMVAGTIIRSIRDIDEKDGNIKSVIKLSEREVEFLKLTCTELTYKEIADKMFISPRTIDGYRTDLFERLNVKTRIGLVLYAIKNGIVSL